MKGKDIIRSSTIEYLSYISSTGENLIDVIYNDENIWMSQKMLGLLYDVEANTITYHLQKLFNTNEINENDVMQEFKIKSSNNKEYFVKHYNLNAIISVGYKVNSEKALQFRKWANNVLEKVVVQGYYLDKERLKSGGTILNKEYYDHLLEDIREIRLSERIFYLKITDIYATSLDYDRNSQTTKDFFAKVQNKIHYAIHGNTAPELIFNRVDAEKENMGLTNWKSSPYGKINRTDVVIAKNYLSKEELESMERIVSAYLDLAEQMAKDHIPMTMKDWAEYLDSVLKLTRKDILKDAGKITREIAERKALSEFEKFRIIQDNKFLGEFERYCLSLIDDKDLSKTE